MPEGLEAEIWRRAAQPIVGRSIRHVWCDERVAPDGLVDTLNDARILAVDRTGKVVQIVTDAGVLGLHLGMTGRIEIDGTAPIERLEYASGADRPEWDRLRLTTLPAATVDGSGAPAVRMNDPRRLGRLSLDEHLELGPDLLTLSAAELGGALGRRTVAIKSLLLDQAAVAGLGNLCADEVLFWAGVAPGRSADELGEKEIVAIARACRTRLSKMLEAGGSTHGALSPQVRAGPAVCPRDGAPLQRSTIGARTAVWCPAHQR
ncbi:MAG: DNA-formamidopyrimidine glycosylase family protein [Ilumatobacter sp.]|uniref:DNA-formamidopyrimidine glycosylase family protein n=1 Tax=Ilumatobacter sp. TaxID=1967498 RepID=UPI003C741AB4